MRKKTRWRRLIPPMQLVDNTREEFEDITIAEFAN